MSILGWWPETVIFGPVFQVQPQIQMSCSQLHKRAERIGCMLMEKGRLNTGDHVALIYPPGQSQIIDLHLKQFNVKGFVVCYEGKSFHLLTQWFVHFGNFMENNSMWRVLSLIMKYCHHPLRSEKIIVKSQNHLSFYQQYSAYILTEILGKFSHLWDICVMQFSGINKLDATFNK